MSGYWDSVDDFGAEKADDLQSYFEEKKRKVARYIRTAKLAQERIDKLQRLEEARKKALSTPSE